MTTLHGRVRKQRIKCVICSKPISAKNCGFPKKEVISFEPKPYEVVLEEKLRKRGIIL